ncbi:MAG: DUF192 domain-containing protein [Candidatus Omnitrophota bacterium]
MWKNKIKIILSCLFILGVIIFYSMPLKPMGIGKKIIFIEVANNADKRAQGLKGRSFLADNAGMLFCFEKEGYPQFWMKDTLIALDIAFIDINKKIVDIQQMSALDEKPRYVPKNKAKYALEMNLGWFQRNGIAIGDKVFFWR